MSYATFLKWKVGHDREWQTLTWLGSISAVEQGKKLVSALCCEISQSNQRREKNSNSPNSSEWSNALILANLLFSLPASNAKVERVFSLVNIIGRVWV